MAQAVIRLAGVDGRSSVFNMYNNHGITTADLVGAVRDYGYHIDCVSEAQFERVLLDAARRDEDAGAVLSLVAYQNREGEDLVPVGADSRFTANALFRLGFCWPIVDNAYLEKVIWALDTLGFFEGGV